MERVHRSTEHPFEEVQEVAVVIGEPNAEQRHTGVLFRDSDTNQVLMLHLARHCDLSCETPDPTFLWISPNVDPRRARQVAVVCRNVWSANGKHIPYAFSPPQDCFDDAGKLLLGPTVNGLTCATFVLAVFHVARLVLIKYGEWPVNRPGDAEWQRRIITLMTGHATEEHIKAMEREVGNARFRPEEVAGAATVTPLPAPFEVAEERGQQILQLLHLGNSN